VKHKNPPAFPRDERYLGHNGMDLRDYFAVQAMAAIISKHLPQTVPAARRDSLEIEVARGAYDYADAMLSARQETRHGE